MSLAEWVLFGISWIVIAAMFGVLGLVAYIAIYSWHRLIKDALRRARTTRRADDRREAVQP